MDDFWFGEKVYNYDHYWMDFDDNDLKVALKHAFVVF
jgi:hypothetical protein